MCELINMKYAIFVLYQGHSTQLTWKDGLWYAALISSGHTISAEFLKDIPFTGAQEVSYFSFGLIE